MWLAMLRVALRAVPANGTTHLKPYFKGKVAIVLHFRKPANRLDDRRGRCFSTFSAALCKNRSGGRLVLLVGAARDDLQGVVG